jgi:hypothetical protein
VYPPHPTQLHVWKPGRLEDAPGPEGQWLTCLRDTRANDRLVVWEGLAGRGLVAVIDFDQQRSSPAARVFEGWGRAQLLDPMIGFASIAAQPLLAARLLGTRGLQGSPKRLTAQEGAAIARLTRLPPRQVPVDEPTYNEEVIFWADDDNGPPEALLEHHIHRRVWRTLGFPSPPEKQGRIASGLRPDLLAPGVVADVKRRISRINGPDQIERYIKELDATQPHHAPWRGLLIHPHDTLDPATMERLSHGPYGHRVEVWAVSKTPTGWRRPQRIV